MYITHTLVSQQPLQMEVVMVMQTGQSSFSAAIVALTGWQYRQLVGLLLQLAQWVAAKSTSAASREFFLWT